MKRLTFPILFLVLSHLALAQVGKDSPSLPGQQKVNIANQKSDSIHSAIQSKLDSFTLPGDSTSSAALKKADSVRIGFQSKVDSLQLLYRKPLNQIDSAKRGLQRKIDSVQTLRLPTEKLTARLDSLNNAHAAKLSELNQKVDKLKSKATETLNGIKAPDQIQGSVDRLTQSIGTYNIPSINGKIPNVDLSSAKIPGFGIPSLNPNMPSLGNVQVPGVNGNMPEVNASIPGVTNQLGGITNETKELTQVTGQVSGYGKDVMNISQGNLDEVKNLDKEAEKKLMSTGEAGQLKGKAAEMDQYKKQLANRPDSAALEQVKKEAMAQVTKEATNHFADQEAVLKQAMGQMSKLKMRYSDVKSMAAPPKKLPNPLHDKTFRERLIPGVTFQIQNRQYFLLDVNALALYRITPRFSAGGGWNYRFAFDNWHIRTEDRIYGPRATVQFNWRKSISLRLSPEIMNTNVPALSNSGLTDKYHRMWVWGVFAGIKTDFRISKSVRGNTEALFNLVEQGYNSPYGDRIVVRFGFEFPRTRKVK